MPLLAARVKWPPSSKSSFDLIFIVFFPKGLDLVSLARVARILQRITSSV
jgi:hypothetical protein